MRVVEPYSTYTPRGFLVPSVDKNIPSPFAGDFKEFFLNIYLKMSRLLT